MLPIEANEITAEKIKAGAVTLGKYASQPVLPQEVKEGETLTVTASSNCHFNGLVIVKGTVEVLGELSETGITQQPWVEISGIRYLEF